MGSEERKAADKKIKEDNIFASLAAGEQEAETDAFQCTRCKQVCFQCIIGIVKLKSIIAQDEI